MPDDRFLIVGLGNPGPRYAGNRHNAGFLVLDELAARVGGRFGSSKANAETVEGRLNGTPVVLAKPKTYMNESGGPIKALALFYKIGVEHLVLVHDELDLPFGTIRLKRGGGEGGHNGLRSTSSAMGDKGYVRVRFGIGRPPGRQDPADYVLRDFAAPERKELPFLVDRTADVVESVLERGVEATQNIFHAESA